MFLFLGLFGLQVFLFLGLFGLVWLVELEQRFIQFPDMGEELGMGCNQSKLEKGKKVWDLVLVLVL